MQINKCESCIYRVESRQGHEIQKQSLCYKNPPTPYPAQVQGGVVIMAVRPVVGLDDWCGGYIKAPPSIIQ